MIRLLLDQGLAQGAAVILRGEGWDVVHISEIGWNGLMTWKSWSERGTMTEFAPH